MHPLSRRRVAMAVVAIAVTGGGLSACGGVHGGAAIYADVCVRCHGASGTPTAAGLEMGAPNFADPVWQQKLTDDGLRRKIRNGGGPGSLMPSFASLSAADLDGLVAYIRSLGPKP